MNILSLSGLSGQRLLLAAAGTGLGCFTTLFMAAPSPQAHAMAVVATATAAAPSPLEGTKAPGTVKGSPYAAAKDTSAGSGAVPLGGTKTPGSQKDSPYAAPKDAVTSLVPKLGKLWGLLVPIALAGGSYYILRSREGDQLT